MMRFRTFPLVIILSVAVAGCYSDPMSQRGFSLPKGDAEAGRDAFVYMQCYQCHTVEGEDFPPVPGAEPPYVQLGGKVSQVKTYGDLVTSIINPSHKLARGYEKEVVSEDGQSKMYYYNDYMTVQELIDIVSYLQPKYDLVVPEVKYRSYH